jgi:hypothetical protein
MAFYKLAVARGAGRQAAAFNAAHTPDTLPDAQDPEYLRRKERLTRRELLVGDDVRVSSRARACAPC